MNPDRIPSFGGELERVESMKTPVYKSRDNLTHVRQYDIFGGNEYYLRYLDQKLSKQEQLEKFAQLFKLVWERISKLLPVPDFQVVVGELTNGEKGVYTIVESVIEPERNEISLEHIRNELINFLKMFASYVKVAEKEGIVWVDLRSQNIVYGHTKSNPDNKWYIVDIDPILSDKLSYRDKEDIIFSFSKWRALALTEEEIRTILES